MIRLHHSSEIEAGEFHQLSFDIVSEVFFVKKRESCCLGCFVVSWIVLI